MANSYSESLCEVRIRNHIADVAHEIGNRWRVLEFQHSTISIGDIRSRTENAWSVSWVYDAREAYEEHRLNVWDRGGYNTFLWKHAPASIEAMYGRGGYLAFDLGYEGVFLVRKLHCLERPWGGWGYVLGHSDFIDHWISGILHRVSSDGKWPN